jgi:hypothetical protein
VSVGAQMSSATVNQSITSLSVAMRNVMTAVANLSLNVNGQGDGLEFLEGLGFDSGDAQSALNAISYLNTVAQVYFGQAVQDSDYDFNQQLSQFWAGQ